MTLRFYIVPMIQVGIYRGPAHFESRAAVADLPLVGVRGTFVDYGLIPVCLVAMEVDTVQETYLSTLSDIQPVPADIDAVITAGQVGTVRTALEAFSIPGTWVNAGDSYRVVMREVIGYFEFMKRLTAITGINPLTLGISLSTQFSQIPQTWQDAMVRAFSELGYNATILVGTSTLRQILRDVSQQNGAKVHNIGGVLI